MKELNKAISRNALFIFTMLCLFSSIRCSLPKITVDFPNEKISFFSNNKLKPIILNGEFNSNNILLLIKNFTSKHSINSYYVHIISTNSNTEYLIRESNSKDKIDKFYRNNDLMIDNPCVATSDTSKFTKCLDFVINQNKTNIDYIKNDDNSITFNIQDQQNDSEYTFTSFSDYVKDSCNTSTFFNCETYVNFLSQIINNNLKNLRIKIVSKQLNSNNNKDSYILKSSLAPKSRDIFLNKIAVSFIFVIFILIVVILKFKSKISKTIYYYLNGQIVNKQNIENIFYSEYFKIILISKFKDKIKENELFFSHKKMFEKLIEEGDVQNLLMKGIKIKERLKYEMLLDVLVFLLLTIILIIYSIYIFEDLHELLQFSDSIFLFPCRGFFSVFKEILVIFFIVLIMSILDKMQSFELMKNALESSSVSGEFKPKYFKNSEI